MLHVIQSGKKYVIDTASKDNPAEWLDGVLLTMPHYRSHPFLHYEGILSG